MAERADTSYREQMLDIQAPPAEVTPWGIRTLDTAGLRQITAGMPTGYYFYPGKFDYLEWIDPENGGAVVMRHQQDAPAYELYRAPHPTSLHDVISVNYTVGNVPTAYANFATSLARNLGYRVLVHTGLITAVQIPGIKDYESAYAAINGQPPDITVKQQHAGSIEGRRFLDLIERGLWPYDVHFYEAHATSLIIGGPEYAAALRGMLRHVQSTSSQDDIDWLGGWIDTYADIQQQVHNAQTRVKRFGDTRLVDDLYLDRNPVGDVRPENAVAMKRFNSVLARYLGIRLPEVERPDIAVPF